MTISDMKAHFRNKEDLDRMIGKFGREESARRMGWLHDSPVKEVEKLFDRFLTDNYLDDKGVKGGNYFWGDL